MPYARSLALPASLIQSVVQAGDEHRDDLDAVEAGDARARARTSSRITSIAGQPE